MRIVRGKQGKQRKTGNRGRESNEKQGEYTFLGRECKSTGIGKIEAEVFMSQEEIFIPRSDSWLSSRGLADDV